MSTIVILTDENKIGSFTAYVVENKDLTEEENKLLDYWVQENEKGYTSEDCSLGTPYDKAPEGQQRYYDLYRMLTGYGQEGKFEPGKFKQTTQITPYLKNVTRVISLFTC